MKYYYKSKKRILVSFMIITYMMNIIFLTSCNSNNKNEYNETENYGNLMSNIINNGLATQTDKWMYAQFQDGLYKMYLAGYIIKVY